jgi:cytochrome c553
VAVGGKYLYPEQAARRQLKLRGAFIAMQGGARLKHRFAYLGCCAVIIVMPLIVAATPDTDQLVAQQQDQGALGRPPDLARGRELFATCAACHGGDGSGVADGSVPAIAGQYAAVIVKQLTDFNNARRWNIRMDKVLYALHITSRADFADVAAYISRLPRHATRDVGDGSALTVGTRAYFVDCEHCHGAVGEGAESSLTPRLRGQHYRYLVRQIRNAGIRWRPNMSSQHERLVRKLSLEQISGVADYLSRLDPN